MEPGLRIPEPDGSAFILAAGSEFEFRVQIGIRIQVLKLKISVLVREILAQIRTGHLSHVMCTVPVAKFTVFDWLIWLTSAQGCRTGLPAYVAWRAGTRILRRSQLLSPQSVTMN